MRVGVDPLRVAALPASPFCCAKKGTMLPTAQGIPRRPDAKPEKGTLPLIRQ